MSATIARVRGRRIWDSRGRPTVEVDVELRDGSTGRGIAPAGASRGTHEAVDLRDGGTAFGGLGVDEAVANVNGPLAGVLIGLDAREQGSVDQALLEIDGTPNKSGLGGNALIATSIAVLQAAASHAKEPLWHYLAAGAPVNLPMPEIQIFGGGAHAGRRVDIQDFLVMPVGAESFDEALVMVSNVYHRAGGLMAERGRLAGVADEGGWWPDFSSNEEALDTLALAIEGAGYRNGEVVISLDIAASEFGSAGCYSLGLERRTYDTLQWLDVLFGWIARYPVVSVEDPVGEDDAAGMQAFTERVGDRVQVVGDDFLVTNAARIDAAAASGACNAALLKPNQAGTVTETRAALERARAHGWGTIVSARSGETEDTSIVHLATGWNAGQIKVGSFARSERMAKWNEALRIEERLGRGRYAGRSALPIPAAAVSSVNPV